MIVSVNKIFRLGTLAILLLVFVLGGFVQYFVGIPTTVYSLSIVILIYILITFDFILRQKLLINKVIITAVILIAFIWISGVVNRTEILKTLLYSLFGLTPLGIFYLFEILKRRKVKIKKAIDLLARFIVIIQLPLVIIQKFGYDFFIRFNNSNQGINDYDFMFGSFFLRADHALGFFLLIYLMSIFIKLRNKIYSKTPWFMVSYISVTILLMGSNLTKMFLIIVLSFYLFRWFYVKIKLIGIILMACAAVIIFNVALTIPALAGEFNNFNRNYTTEQSLIAYEGTYAKRPQIVIAYATHFPLKIIGHGPYDYFDIFSGRFKKTQHFSQVIWTYNDLGIIGLMISLLLIFYVSRGLGLNKEPRRVLFALLLFYLFMTNVFSDLAMGLSLLLINNDLE